MNYDEMAKEISKEMIKYNATKESLTEVFNLLCKKRGITDYMIRSEILAKVVHYISIFGYDIDNIRPLRFKKFL